MAKKLKLRQQKNINKYMINILKEKTNLQNFIFQLFLSDLIHKFIKIVETIDNINII